MLNSAQYEVLNNLMSDDSDHFQNIKNYKLLNSGTKVFYLKRAIHQQDCQTFLKALDRIYMEHGLKNREANLAFIRSLKFINDIYFNNQIKPAPGELQAALIHHFGTGENIELNDFQTVIREKINEKITALYGDDEEAVKFQEEERARTEKNITRNPGWRTTLDLPFEQWSLRDQASQICFLIINGNLTEEQYHSLSYKLKQYITCHYANVPLFEKYTLAFEEREKLNPNRSQILSENPRLLQIINQMGMSLDAFLALDERHIAFISEKKIYALILKYTQEIKALVEEGISFKEILALLKRGQPQPVIDFKGIEPLIEAGISIKEILGMAAEIQSLLFKNSQSLKELAHDRQIPLKNILALDKNMLTIVLDMRHSKAIERLLHPQVVWDKNGAEIKIGISFKELFALDKNILQFLLKNDINIQQLAKDINVPFKEILALDESIRALVVNKSDVIIHLVNHLNVLFKDIIALDQNICELLLTKPKKIYTLIEIPVCYKQIFDLNKDKLEFVLKHMGDMNTARFKYREFCSTHSTGTLKMLLKHAHFPFIGLLALDEDIRTLMVEYSYEIVQLVKKDVTYNILSQLPLEKLATVLKYPSSKNAQDILQAFQATPAPLHTIKLNFNSM